MNKKLTNLDISENYRDRDYYIHKKTILGKFAEWVVRQSPYDTPDITKPLQAFNTYVTAERFTSCTQVERFTYDELYTFINEDVFEQIPEIEALNNRKNGRDGIGLCSKHGQPDPDDDFIDLGALARNIFFSLCREGIVED